MQRTRWSSARTFSTMRCSRAGLVAARAVIQLSVSIALPVASSSCCQPPRAHAHEHCLPTRLRKRRDPAPHPQNRRAARRRGRTLVVRVARVVQVHVTLTVLRNLARQGPERFLTRVVVLQVLCNKLNRTISIFLPISSPTLASPGTKIGRTEIFFICRAFWPRCFCTIIGGASNQMRQCLGREINPAGRMSLGILFVVTFSTRRCRVHALVCHDVSVDGRGRNAQARPVLEQVALRMIRFMVHDSSFIAY